MNQRKEHLEQLINEGYPFKFGEYIGRGVELFQKNIGGFIGYGLLAGVIIFFSSLILGFVPIIGPILQNIFVTVPLTVGAYIVAHEMDKGNYRVDFSRFFEGFMHIAQLALTALLIGLIIIVSMVPFMLALWFSDFLPDIITATGDPESVLEAMNQFPVWSLLLLIPTVYLSVAYSWAYQFVVFFKMNFWDAMEYSRRIVHKQWLLTCLFIMIVAILGSLGAIVLIIGILFTYPIMLCAQYAAFADITRLLEEQAAEENDLLDHLVE